LRKLEKRSAERGDPREDEKAPLKGREGAGEEQDKSVVEAKRRPVGERCPVGPTGATPILYANEVGSTAASTTLGFGSPLRPGDQALVVTEVVVRSGCSASCSEQSRSDVSRVSRSLRARCGMSQSRPAESSELNTGVGGSIAPP